MSETDVLKMKVADLKRELKLRGLSTTGNKTELQERLQTALLEGDLSLEDTAISEELLDEDVLTDEEEKAALASPTDEKDLLQEIKAEEEKPASSEGANQQTKKVVLKRKNSLTIVGSALNNSIDGTTAKENAAPPEKLQKIDEEKLSDSSESNKIAANSEGKKIVKLSELSMKERLEMRAKKFGLNAKETSATTIKSVEAPSTEKEQQQIQALKKRAERFGCVLSSKIVDMEKQEKLQKRQERFGASPATDSDSKPTKDVYAEKAKLRLERFKAK